MYCRSCGKYIEKNSKVCAHCGYHNFHFGITSVGKIRNYINTYYIRCALIYIIILLVLTFLMTLFSPQGFVEENGFMPAWVAVFILTGMVWIYIPYRITMLRRIGGWTIVFYFITIMVLGIFT